jgi:sulfate/thiosulfate transport system ATP-binding protein
MAVRFEQLSKRYEGKSVVSNVSLQIDSGTLCVLLGPSGSGKSTLLRVAAGLVEPDAGRVEIDGRDLAGVPARDRDCGFVFQSYALFRRMTVAENVEFALKVRHVPRRERRARRDELLELVGLAGLGARMPGQLSGGQQQRVALARALAHRPKVLLLDEPFGALDARIRGELRGSLRAIQRELHLTTLFVTHDQEEAFDLGDRIAILAQGRLIEEGTPDDLYLRPQTEFSAIFLGGGNLWVGQGAGNAVRLGAAELPLGGEVRADPAARRLQVLVRPEDVALARQPAALGAPAVGEGEVIDASFVGSVERLRVAVPALAGVRAIHPPPRFGEACVSVEATRPQHAARSEPLRPGDRVWVGVRRLHALMHPGLRMVAVGEDGAAAYAAELARLAQATLDRAADERALVARLARDEADVVIALAGDIGAAEDLLRAAPESHCLLVPGTARPLPPRRLLVAVAVGEPGKEDVAFTGRLGRHFGARATVLTVLPETTAAAERAAAERFLAACVRTLERYGVPAVSEIGIGDLGESVRTRLSSGDDLLVVGTPLPDESGDVRFGRAGRDLLEAAASVPVLVVRASVRGGRSTV